MSAPTVRRILFPTDYSRCAEGAYRHAAYLADRFSAELYVLHVSGNDVASSTRIRTEGTGHLQITMADVYEDLKLPVPEPEPDYDEDSTCRLSKAERKRLRKQQNRDRAA